MLKQAARNTPWVANAFQAVVPRTAEERRGTAEERRVAPDGQQYTQTEFVTYYGSTHEWDAAATHQVWTSLCCDDAS